MNIEKIQNTLDALRVSKTKYLDDMKKCQKVLNSELGKNFRYSTYYDSLGEDVLNGKYLSNIYYKVICEYAETHFPNITFNAIDLKDKLINYPLDKVIEFMQENYTMSSVPKTIKSLRDKAKRLFPLGYGLRQQFNRGDLSVVDKLDAVAKKFVTGRRLKLYVSTESNYNGEISFYNSAKDNLIAFDKLLQIKFLNSDARFVKGAELSNAPFMIEYNIEIDQFKKYIYCTGKAVESYRLYKNGSMRITFKNRQAAVDMVKYIFEGN